MECKFHYFTSKLKSTNKLLFKQIQVNLVLGLQNLIFQGKYKIRFVIFHCTQPRCKPTNQGYRNWASPTLISFPSSCIFYTKTRFCLFLKIFFLFCIQFYPFSLFELSFILVPYPPVHKTISFLPVISITTCLLLVSWLPLYIVHIFTLLSLLP